jgi:hypothetical protein
MGYVYGGQAGVRPSAGSVPQRGSQYTSFLNQYYPNWKQTVMGGGAYPVQPGQRLQQGDPGFGGGGGQGQFRGELFASDPRQILEGDAYQRLLQLSKGGGAGVKTARGVMGPGIDYITGALGQRSPLGEGRGELVRQAGFGAAQTAGETARRRIGEASTQFGRAADPEALSFSGEMTRFGQAEAIGQASRAGAQMDLDERLANEQFKSSLTSVLSSMGLGLGGLELQGMGLETQAAIGAGQLESFARNTWSEIMGRLTGIQLGAGNRAGPGFGGTLESRGLARSFQDDQMRQFMSDQGYYNWPTFPKFSGG